MKGWTRNDVKEVLRITGELVVIVSGFALPSVFLPMHFQIPVYVATVILTLVFLSIEHNRYLRKNR